MRRAAAVLVLAAALVAGLTAAGGEDRDGYRVDAIFDNVAFLTEGQDVRVAGAVVGEVEGLEVTDGDKARVRLRVDERFAPFRADADCTIQPQSLIGERFVQCTPGTPSAPPLAARGDAAPTVPLENTHAPVDLDLVLATFDRPVRERLGILLGSLGAGLAGRGEDLGAAILRANPALQETRRVLDVLGHDRERLRRLISDGDAVLAELAARREDVGAFVREGAQVMSETARRRERVAESVRRLPALLAEADPALERLSAFARAGTPLAGDLREAAPDLDALLARTGSFARDLRPALRRLQPAVAATREALPDVAPQLRRLRRFAADADPAGELVAALLGSLHDQGALDGLGAFFYYTAAAVSRFDRYGHYLPAYIIGTTCALPATTPMPGCSARYSSYDHAAHARSRGEKRRAPAAKEQRPERQALTVRPRQPEQPAEKPAGTPRPRLPALEDLPKVLDDLGKGLEQGLQQDVPAAVEKLLDDLGLGLGGLRGEGKGREGSPSPPATDRLLDLLLR